jgi:hypothetical protein
MRVGLMRGADEQGPDAAAQGLITVRNDGSGMIAIRSVVVA